MEVRLRESFDHHDWELRDVHVTQLILDPGTVRIVAWHLTGSADIRLGAPFVYAEADGVEREIDPEHTEQVAPLLSLVHRSLDGITVYRSGTLLLRFGDGSTTRIDPHARFEAWEARGEGASDELSYLCSPGGGSPWGAA